MFALRQKIWIEPLKRAGHVIAIYISETGAQYQVRYFDNSEAKTVYFYPDELELFRLPNAEVHRKNCHD